MTIDERIEALAHSVEPLASFHRDTEKHLQAHAEFERRMTEYARDVKDAIKRLTNIIEAQSETLEDHEGRIDDLES